MFYTLIITDIYNGLLPNFLQHIISHQTKTEGRTKAHSWIYTIRIYIYILYPDI